MKWVPVAWGYLQARQAAQTSCFLWLHPNWTHWRPLLSICKPHVIFTLFTVEVACYCRLRHRSLHPSPESAIWERQILKAAFRCSWAFLLQGLGSPASGRNAWDSQRNHFPTLLFCDSAWNKGSCSWNKNATAFLLLSGIVRQLSLSKIQGQFLIPK